MPSQRKLIVFLFQLTAIAHLFSQGNYLITPIGTRQGLASSQVSKIIQDDLGYIWVATSVGISRYDGSIFQNFYKAGDHPIGNVQALTKDAEGTVWIGSENGLFYFKDENFVSIESTHPLQIISLKVDHLGGLWAGCNNASPFYFQFEEVTRLKQTTKGTMIPLMDDKEWEEISWDRLCFSIDEDQLGNIYFGTDFSLFQWDGIQLNELVRDEEQYRIEYLTAIDPDNIFWGGRHHPFFQLKGKNNRAVTHDQARGILKFKDELYLLTANNLWLWTDNELVSVVNLSEYSNTLFHDLTLDREGNFWIGSDDGLLKVSSTVFQQYHNADHPDIYHIYSMTELDNQQILLGSNHGKVLRYYNDHFFPFFENDYRVVSRAEVFAFFENERNDLWMATGYQGIVRLKEGKFQSFRTEEGLRDDSNFFFIKDKKGQLWTGGDSGITKIIEADDGKINFQNFFWHPPDRGDFPHIRACVEDQFGHFWMTSNMGLFYFAEDSLVRVQLPGPFNPYPSLTDIVIDKKHFFWISTQGYGILKCKSDAQGRLKIIDHFDQQDGLASDVFLQLHFDKSNHLWAATYHGICRLNVEDSTKSTLCFDKRDGWMDISTQYIELFESSDSILWAAGLTGITKFNPYKLQINGATPNVMITSVELFDGQSNIYKYSNNKEQTGGIPSGLVLPYNQNFLRFHCVGLSQTQPTKNKYKVMLEGADPNWQQPSHQRNFPYPGLPPGKYTFKVLASNNDALWSEAPATFSFTITPPFWHRWWFIASILISMVGSALLSYNTWHRRIRAKKDEKQRIDKLLSDFKIQALRAQMNPHFLFNSLNSIQECVITKNTETAYRYLSKFSRLLRLVLDHSDRSFIALEQEIAMISLYLELEALRFGSTFQYTILLPPELDDEGVLVPSMLLQPFIENAIWHGLLHKNGKRKLHIQFSETIPNFLTCIIEDNGIGRQEAAKIRAGQIKTQNHQSKGMKLSSERLNLLREQSKKDAKVNIIDLIDAKGRARGTRVVVTLPMGLSPF